MNAFVAPAALTGLSKAPAGAVICRHTTFFAPQTRSCTVPRLSCLRMPRASLESDVREELKVLYDDKPCMPIMVRLAWHDSGTYNHEDGSGGPNASIRFQPEKGHGANNGLDIAMDLLEPIKSKFPDISYADLYQLASVVAVEYCGGPKIPFRLGRVDVTQDSCTDDGRLPAADKGMGHLRDIFFRMGFNDAEIIALSGAHTLGRAHMERSGFDGPWTYVPVVFDNTYYVEILKDDPDPSLLRLTSDMALLDSTENRALCEKYAKDQAAFFKDYSAAHQKLSELGCFA